VLATEGTAASGAYRDLFAARGICVEPLTREEQDGVSRLIFEQIKSGLAPDMELFNGVCESLRARGCQVLILGCTELSLIKKQYTLQTDTVDSLELLALAAIVGCGKTPVGFDSGIMNFYADSKNITDTTDTTDTKGKEG
jgi:aspartate racemase